MNIYAAEVINHALQVYAFPENRVLLSNHGKYAGGGGTQRDFFLKVCSVNQVMNEHEYTYVYLMSSSQLKSLYLVANNITLGDGGLIKRNAL